MELTPEIWRRLDEAFACARALEPAARAEFLARLQDEDATLAEEVSALLDSDAEAGATFLEPATGTDRDLSPGMDAGRRIGACELRRFLGEGGMGAVYEAVQHPLGRPVAVKLLRGSLFAAGARERFEHEIRLLARLRHPGIAEVYEAGSFEDATTGRQVPYFVMELIPGAEPVTQAAGRRGLDHDARLHLFLEICDAVAHAHGRGVIHRDLKPANILVGADGRPKLIDFGVARADDAAGPGGRSFQTEAGALVGTLPYMSPEQLGPDPGDVDVRADVYGLGVVLYELLCGRRPHSLEGLGLDEAIQCVRDAPAAPASRHDAALAGDAEAVLARALEKDRERRYPTVAALADDVGRLRRGDPVLARAPSLLRQLRSVARRHRTAFVAAGATGLSLAAAAVVSAVFAFRAEEAREREAGQARAARNAGARAEALFTEGRGLADWVIHDLQYELERLAGAMSARRKLSERILAYLDGLSRIESDDLGLVTEIAKAYEQVGRIAGDPGAQNLGDPATALAAFEKALQAYERLAALQPESKAHRRDAAVAAMRIASVVADHGDAREALPRARAALRVFEGLREGGPDHPSARDLARARRSLGGILERNDDPPAARRSYEDARALFAALAAASPGDEVAARDVAGVDHDLGFLCRRAGDLPAARAAFGRLEAATREAARDPANARAEADLANALLGLAECDFAEDDAAAALGRFREAAALFARRVEADPADTGAARHLGMARGGSAEALSLTGDAEAALIEADAAIRIFEALPETVAGSTRGLRDRWEAWSRRGTIAYQAGRPAEAAVAWTQGAASGEKVVAAGGVSAADRTQLASHLRSAAVAVVDAGEGAPDDDRIAALREAQALCVRALAALKGPEPEASIPPGAPADEAAAIERLAADCARRLARLESDR